MKLETRGRMCYRNKKYALGPTEDVLARNRRSIAIDLKQPEGAETVLRLCASADGLFEGFRPGVTERLGIGPRSHQITSDHIKEVMWLGG